MAIVADNDWIGRVYNETFPHCLQETDSFTHTGLRLSLICQTLPPLSSTSSYQQKACFSISRIPRRNLGFQSQDGNRESCESCESFFSLLSSDLDGSAVCGGKRQ